jgi:hypothetical protein
MSAVDQLLQDAKYLEEAGMDERELTALHHFSGKGRVTYAKLRDHFGRIRSPREKNARFAERVRYVVVERKRDRARSFPSLVSEALKRWPI